MTARLIGELGPAELPPASQTNDLYANYRCTWEADTPEEALEAARNWVWERIGSHDGSFIRSVPSVDSDLDFETGLTTHRATARVSVRVAQASPTSFGMLEVKA